MNRCPPILPSCCAFLFFVHLAVIDESIAQVDSIRHPAKDVITVDIPIHAGWNLISNPVQTATDTLISIFPGGGWYGYRYVGFGWMQTGVLPRGVGIWDRFPAAGIAHVTGEAVASDTFQVHHSWNIVGSISYPVLTSRITSNPPGIIISPFYYHDGSFVKADTIRPGFGYCVKISAVGEIILSVAPFAGP